MTNPLHPEQFGMSEREAAEIKGKALGGHLFDQMEGIFGSYKANVQGAAYDNLSHRFGSHNVQIDEEGSPYYEVHEGSHALRYHGGSTFNYYKHGKNVDASTTYEHGDMLSSDFRNRLHQWVQEDSDYY